MTATPVPVVGAGVTSRASLGRWLSRRSRVASMLRGSQTSNGMAAPVTPAAADSSASGPPGRAPRALARM